MAGNHQDRRVKFVVDYEDGRTAELSIDRWTLSLGDYAAMLIARERQEKGDLPPGEIKTVRPILGPKLGPARADKQRSN